MNLRVSLLPVCVAIAIFSSVSAQEASPVKYSTNDVGMEFAPIPAIARGPALVFMIVATLSLAFMGFAGMGSA